MSRTLTVADVPAALRSKVRLSAQTTDALMHELEAEGWSRAYVDGGKIVTSFLQAGLIADTMVTHIPVLIGEGLPLFGALGRDIDLQHIETRSYPSGLVGTRYNVLPPD